jgi:hypothetical protein
MSDGYRNLTGRFSARVRVEVLVFTRKLGNILLYIHMVVFLYLACISGFL